MVDQFGDSHRFHPFHLWKSVAVPGIALLWCLCGSVVWVGAEEPSAEPVTVRKTKDGLQFQVPPDWPIETRGGITAPIPIEEYLGQKFKAIERQLQALEQRQGTFAIRLQALEEEMKQQREALQSKEQSPTPGAAPTAGAAP